jgi:hypothetical protein
MYAASLLLYSARRACLEQPLPREGKTIQPAVGHLLCFTLSRKLSAAVLCDNLLMRLCVVQDDSVLLMSGGVESAVLLSYYRYWDHAGVIYPL